MPMVREERQRSGCRQGQIRAEVARFRRGNMRAKGVSGVRFVHGGWGVRETACGHKLVDTPVAPVGLVVRVQALVCSAKDGFPGENAKFWTDRKEGYAQKVVSPWDAPHTGADRL